MRHLLRGGIIAYAIVMGTAGSSYAATYSSPNFSIDGGLGGSFSGQQSSSSYALTSRGGESIAGVSASSSYSLGVGFPATLTESLKLTLDQTSIDFPALTPGSPQTRPFSLSVQTDAPGYTIAAHQSGNLSSGDSSIPPIPGTIASPIPWVNGDTKGLGFTVASASSTAPSASWANGTNYAAFPDSATSIYTRTGQTGGVTDTLSSQIKLDVAATQAAANYSNQVTITGTIIP